MNLPYYLYMAEAEGKDRIVQTRTARLNAIVSAIKFRNEYPIKLSTIVEIAEEHNIYDLSYTDVAYIEDRI